MNDQSSSTHNSLEVEKSKYHQLVNGYINYAIFIKLLVIEPKN
jgi:hypothetical protein